MTNNKETICPDCNNDGWHFSTVVRHVKRRQSDGQQAIRCEVDKIRVTCECPQGDLWMETHGLRFIG